jgi:hypothetical protein
MVGMRVQGVLQETAAEVTYGWPRRAAWGRRDTKNTKNTELPKVTRSVPRGTNSDARLAKPAGGRQVGCVYENANSDQAALSFTHLPCRPAGLRPVSVARSRRYSPPTDPFSQGVRGEASLTSTGRLQGQVVFCAVSRCQPLSFVAFVAFVRFGARRVARLARSH